MGERRLSAVMNEDHHLQEHSSFIFVDISIWEEINVCREEFRIFVVIILVVVLNFPRYFTGIVPNLHRFSHLKQMIIRLCP
jgi:hypothetical protein